MTIFITMRINSYIFSFTFILVFGLLHIQPLLPKAEVKKEKTCAKSKCSNQTPTEEKKDCQDDACNPFVPCATGPCCYLVENFFTYSTSTIVSGQNLSPRNDNRLLNRLAECWRPPKMISWFPNNLFYNIQILKNEKNIFKHSGYCHDGCTGCIRRWWR